jgi:predicted 2-oxoglutarate/Fe(II)-dependent dioxygenase YbiX
MSQSIQIHSPRAFSIPAFLTAQECSQLIQLAQAHGFSSAGVRTTEGERSMPTIRNNEQTMVEAPEWVSLMWSRLCAVDMPAIDGAKAAGLPKDLRFYKYSPGQRFKMHKDGPWQENGMTSRLTLLVYLNDDFTGGQTDFREFKVAPEAGSALLFVHDTWHEGMQVVEGVKYVLRSDVLCL